MRMEPYLRLNDIEVANSIRTYTYLRRGLGGNSVGTFRVELCHDFTDTAGYVDAYDDVYAGDPFDPRELCCYCRTVDTGPYKDPAYDNAAWFDEGRPESKEFLGFIPEIRLLPVNKRAVTRRSAGGGILGPAVATPRVLQVVGTMYASSAAGMGYGESWLRHVLAGSSGGCGIDVLTVVPACPIESEAGSSAFRQLAAVGIVDGPTFTPEGSTPECVLGHVAFQMVAGEPYLRKVVTQTSDNLGSAGTICATIQSGVIFDSGAQIVITATSTLDGATISPIGVTIRNMPAGTLTIDPTRRAVEMVTATGVVVPPLQFTGILDFDKLMSRDGALLTVCVDGTVATGAADATVVISSVEIES